MKKVKYDLEWAKEHVNPEWWKENPEIVQKMLDYMNNEADDYDFIDLN